MSLTHCRYRPTGTFVKRISHALFLCYVNLHHRIKESREQSLYVQLDRLEAR